jgi:uncharacterized membrane protein
MNWIENLFGGATSPVMQRLVVVFCSALPVIELKGSIPLGMAMGVPDWQTFFLALLGSSLPVIPLMLFMQPVIRWMYGKRFLARFAVGGRRHARRGGEKYEYWGVFIRWHSVPTGVWTDR